MKVSKVRKDLLIPKYSISKKQFAIEIARLNTVFSLMHKTITETKNKLSNYSYLNGIYNTYLTILNENKIVEKTEKCLIEEGKNLEWCLYVVIDGLIKSKKLYFDKERILDLGHYMMSKLLATKDATLYHCTLVVETNDKLIHELNSNPKLIYNINPRKFEEIVGDVLYNKGYKIQLTPQTRDGGRDILAYYKDPLGDSKLMIVECKRYDKEYKIGVDAIRQFLFTIRDYDKANSGLFATTSFFSYESKKLVSDYNWLLKLKDFNDIKEWLSDFGDWQDDENTGLWLPKNDTGDHIDNKLN